MEYTKDYESPIGKILLSSDGEHLTGLWFEGQKYFQATLEREHEQKNLQIFDETKQWLDSYFQGKSPNYLPSLAPKGSEFRQLIWRILCEVSCGGTITYGEIARIAAKRMGIKSMSAQAVGGAVGHNPISIIIPCHRVIGTDGSLTGYAGGTEKKKWLLELEAAMLHL